MDLKRNNYYLKIYDAKIKSFTKRYVMKKSVIKQIAMQRVKILIDRALYSSDEFSDHHVMIAKKIILKYKLKIPFEYKVLFCKQCKNFIIPGRDSIIRIGRSNTKALRITCKLCGHTYRKIIEKPNQT